MAISVYRLCLRLCVQAGLKRGVVDQDGDGQVSQREQEDFDELTKDLKAPHCTLNPMHHQKL